MEASTNNVKYSEAPVEVALAPSRAGAWIVASMALSTFLVVLATPGPPLARIAMAAAIGWCALDAVHAIALHRGRRGARRLVVTMAGEIYLCNDGDEWRTGVVRPGSFVAPWLTIIRWRAPTHRFDRTVLILPDMVAEHDFRRLRVMLRWGGSNRS